MRWWKPLRVLREDGSLFWDNEVLNTHPDRWLPQIQAMPPGLEVSLETAFNYAGEASTQALFRDHDAKRSCWILLNWVEFCQQSGLQIRLTGSESVEILERSAC